MDLKHIRVLVEHYPDGYFIALAYLGPNGPDGSQLFATSEPRSADVMACLLHLDAVLTHRFSVSLSQFDFTVEHAFVDEDITSL